MKSLLLQCSAVVLLMLASGPGRHVAGSGTRSGQESGPPARILLVPQDTLSPGAGHGLSILREALEKNGNPVEQIRPDDRREGGVRVIVQQGPGSADAAERIGPEDRSSLSKPESFVIRRSETPSPASIAVIGSDERGLMYGLMELAEHVTHTANPRRPFLGLQSRSRSPFVPERAISKTVMNRSEFESYCFSEEYWEHYFDMLARNRFSTFVLIFGYSSAGYFDPPYPFLFDLNPFPSISVDGLSAEEQARNLTMLQRIVAMAKERGLEFTLAIWTHIHRSQRDDPEAGTVRGLSGEKLVSYTTTALPRLLELVPGIDALQFRVHVESSLTLPEQVGFWSSVLSSVREVRPDIRIDMRVKGLTDDMIDAALASDLAIRLDTKFWGEQMGLPFHPTHLTTRNQFKRRHGYADLLRHPARYRMHYRLWNVGTTRILQWADPEYVRRFAASTLLCDGDGFEVHEPLAFKMAHQRGETFALLKPDHRYYQWEFERYWPFFQTFGRVSYDPDVSDETLGEAFEARFGQAAGEPLRAALAAASRVLPRINAYSLSDLSADHTWAEKQRWEDLATYVWAEPSDTAQFLGIEEAARLLLQGRDSPKIWPQQTSRWFARTSQEVLDLIEQAEQQIGGRRGREFDSFVVDLKVLAGLAEYHGRRIHAGIAFALFQKTQNVLELERAIHWETQAVSTWREIADLTRDVYADNVIMGRTARLQGSWSTELTALEKELGELRAMLDHFQPEYRKVVERFDFGDGPVAEGFKPVPSQYRILYDWLPWDKATNYDRVKGGYGWLHSFLSSPPELKSGSIEREELRDFVSGPDPTQYSYSSFGADVPSGRYELVFSMSDQSTEPRDWGPMWIVANGLDSTPKFEVPAGEVVTMRLPTTVTDGRLNVVFNSRSDSQWLVNSLEIVRLEPLIAHLPIRRIPPGTSLEIDAAISGPDPIVAARVGYSVDSRGIRFLEMTEETRPHFSATIPAPGAGRISYFIEATDVNGRVVSYPGPEREDWIQVRVSGDTEPPEVMHELVRHWPAGKALPIQAVVEDPSGVRWVRLRYRGVNQHQDFRTLELQRDGTSDRFRGEIPGPEVRPEWDLMYYLEVMDDVGNGRIYPDLESRTPYQVVELGRD